MNPILHNLKNLTNFRDRQTRGQFWPYALAVLALMFAVNAVIFAVVLTQGIGLDGQGVELRPDFGQLILGIGALAFGIVLLLAAAVTRRLHDRGKSGLWAAPPIIFLISGFAIMSTLFGKLDLASPDLALFGVGLANNALYLASLVILIIWLVGPSAPGENRYGPAQATPPR